MFAVQEGYYTSGAIEFQALVGEVAAAMSYNDRDNFDYSCKWQEWCVRFAISFAAYNPNYGEIPPESLALKSPYTVNEFSRVLAGLPIEPRKRGRKRNSFKHKNPQRYPDLYIKPMNPTERRRELIKRYEADGLCKVCGEDRDDPLFKMCSACRMKEAARRKISWERQKKQNANTGGNTGTNLTDTV